MATQHVHWTPSGVRLRLHRRRDGDVNWLFLPGGPGIGSECLQELVDAVAVSGCSWLVDLPGDGSNTDAPGAPADPYSGWPQVLLEAAQAVDRPIYVGHSTGGEYLLSTPALAGVLHGLVLISTAPDASWIPVYEEITTDHPLPGAERATARYDSDPTNETLREVAVDSAPWNFLPISLAAGAEMLARMPYNLMPCSGRRSHFDRDYQMAWWPDYIANPDRERLSRPRRHAIAVAARALSHRERDLACHTRGRPLSLDRTTRRGPGRFRRTRTTHRPQSATERPRAANEAVR